VGVVNLAVVAYVLGTTTKRVVNFLGKKYTLEKILATPMIQLADFLALKFSSKLTVS